jgi:hypothetical protein
MANLEATGRGRDTAAGSYVLNTGTLIAAAVAVCLGVTAGRAEEAGCND